MVAKDHGPSVKDDEQYEALRREGMSKEKAARIANESASSSRSEVGTRGATAENYEDRTVEELQDKGKEIGLETAAPQNEESAASYQVAGVRPEMFLRMRQESVRTDAPHSDPSSTGLTANGNGRASQAGSESDLLELFAEWVQGHHRDGGDFSIDAIVSAGDAGRNALRSGYSLQEAFEQARNAYFVSLAHVVDASDPPAAEAS